MLTKIYQAVGLALCIGLGVAFAMGWKAPDLGFLDGGSGSGTGRGGFFFSGGGGGFHFGK